LGSSIGVGVGVGVGEADRVRLYFIWPNAIVAIDSDATAAITIRAIISKLDIG